MIDDDSALPNGSQSIDASPSLLDGASPVRDGEELDTEKLADILREAGFPPDAAIEVTQFPRGFSNLTYLVKAGTAECILRRPPFGVGKGNAHDVVREARVLESVGRVYSKVPRILAIHEDPALLGAPFYLMERVRGVILRDRVPPDLSLGVAQMRALSESVVDTLADIHAVDWNAAGLATLGNPTGYVQRQVAGWTKRYRAAATSEVASLDTVAAWLAAHQPPERGASLIHNDFKFDNLVLAPNALTRVLAVLDWEMVTVGDPLMDLGTTLAYWVEPNDAPAIRALGLGVTATPGALTREGVVDRYASRSRRGVGDVVFYFAYGLFKVAVIAQQIHARYVRGFTSDPRFAHLDRAVAALGAAAANAIDTRRLTPSA